jgi:uncharacterized repeat protein (TIGR01451 family)
MVSALPGGGARAAVVAVAALLLAPAAASAATDVSVAAGAEPTTVKRGDQVVFSVDVRNGGAEPAQAVTVTQSYPLGIRIVSAQASQGSCELSDSVTCALGTLEPGGQATVTITARATSVDRLELFFSVETESDETDFENNRASATVDVLGPPARLSGLRLGVPVVRVGRHNVFVFFMSRPATVTFAVQRRTPRRRWRTVGIAFRGRVPAEENVRAFRGRVRRNGRVRPLRPGRYRVRATTTDDLSVPSPPVFARFSVVR